MTEINRKRKATDQLSPFSEDLIEQPKDVNRNVTEPSNLYNEPIGAFKKARVKKDNGVTNQSLKGIFGQVSLQSQESKKTYYTKDEMIAGLNNSFLKCIKKILKQQSNKDLSKIFEQYSKYLKDIDENNK